MAGKARVHELAKEFGVTSKELLARLKDMGEFVKSASSTVEPPVARRLRDTFESNGKPKSGPKPGAPRKQAAPAAAASAPAPAADAPAKPAGTPGPRPGPKPAARPAAEEVPAAASAPAEAPAEAPSGTGRPRSRPGPKHRPRHRSRASSPVRGRRPARSVPRRRRPRPRRAGPVPPSPVGRSLVRAVAPPWCRRSPRVTSRCRARRASATTRSALVAATPRRSVRPARVPPVAPAVTVAVVPVRGVPVVVPVGPRRPVPGRTRATCRPGPTRA